MQSVCLLNVAGSKVRSSLAILTGSQYQKRSQPWLVWQCKWLLTRPPPADPLTYVVYISSTEAPVH
jgi:hypothetical protein